PLKELAANFLEPRLQLRRKAESLARRLDDQQPVIAGIIPARNKTARFEPVDKPRDLAFVSAHGLGELSGRRLSFLRAVHEHRRLLCRHAELAETTIKRRLQPNAGTKE